MNRSIQESLAKEVSSVRISKYYLKRIWLDMQLLLLYYYHGEKLHLREFKKLLEKPIPISKIVIIGFV